MPVTIERCQWRLLIAVAALRCCLPVHAAPADDYRQGIEAFQGQRYEQALQYFTAAKNAGMNSPNLTYNLGSVYFRLGRFEQSFAQYRLLANDPAWGALAHYNMGLIEEAQGRSSRALDHYRLAYERATNPKMKALAAAKLSMISTASTTAGDAESWSGLVSVSAGFDDNVLLYANDATFVPSNEHDYFSELRALTSGYISGALEGGWRMDLSAYYRAYAQEHEFDFGVGNIGLTYSRLFETWYLESGGKLEAQLIGGEYMTTVGKINLQVLRPAGSVVIRLRDELSYYQPESGYQFIGGWQNRTIVDVTHRSPGKRVQFGYELELNRRDDLVQGQEFFSYSPLRHKLFVNAGYDFTNDLRLEGQIDYRMSDYPDMNIQLNPDTSLTVAKRRDDRWSGYARLTYQASRLWSWFGEYQYANNDANFNRYTYTNNQVNLGFERMF